jgi:hypothetical protein
LITVKQYDAVNDTATTDEISIDVNCKYINYIINDDATNDLYVGFENSTLIDDNYVIIKPEEKFLNFKVTTSKIYFRSSASTVDFRFLCKKDVM